MIEQLWYTWTTKGLGNSPGYQIRAASAGLRESNGKRYQVFRNYLNYYLPQGSDLATATPQNSPVTLAFLDIGETTVAEKGRNTHIVLHKTYNEKDAHGRPATFFAHLIDVLPQNFLACDAIDLWGSSFWCISETSQPTLPNNFLPQLVTKDDLLPNNAENRLKALHYQYAQAILKADKDLIYLIQAFLWLKPTQKLYIAGHWNKVAALIWGLTQSLPRSLQQAQNLTFSTYEKEIGQTSARIEGTCRPPAFYDRYEQYIGKAQEMLPAMVFTGSGPAFALDCDTGHRTTLPQGTEDARMLAEYAEYTVGLLTAGLKKQLAELLTKASDNEVLNTNNLLTFIKTHIDEIAKKDWTPQEITRLLRERKDAAGNLSGGNILNSLLDHWINDNLSTWRKNEAQPLLEKLRPVTITADKDDIKLRNAFLLLAQRALAKLAENFQNDAVYDALQTLLSVCLFPDTERELQICLVNCLKQQFTKQPGFGRVLSSLSWEKRYWLLQQIAPASTVQPVDDGIIIPLLPQTWSELHVFLDAKENFRNSWQKRAISENIRTTLSTHEPFPQSSARMLLEKHSTELFSAIKELLQTPSHQPLALQFCIQLLHMIVKRKRPLMDALSYLWHKMIDSVMIVPRALKNTWNYILSIFIQRDQPNEALIMNWKTVVIPVLGIEISAPGHPIDLDELLRAAQLRQEDQYFLIEQYPNLVLSPSHLLSPFVEKICGTFLDRLIDKAEELAERSQLHHFYSSKVLYSLEYLRRVDFSDQRRNRHTLDLLCLMITAREERFEQYLTQDQDFLPNLVGSIRRFQLSKDEVYMGNLHRTILRKPRSAKELNLIIDHLASLFEDENRQKNHPENKRKFFADLVHYAGKKNYTFQAETLLLYAQLAFEYANNLSESNQKRFLTPVLKNIDNTRSHSYAFSRFDLKVQDAFDRTPKYLELWRKYNPGQPEQRVRFHHSSKQKKQQTVPENTPGQADSGKQSIGSTEDYTASHYSATDMPYRAAQPTSYNEKQSFSQPDDSNLNNPARQIPGRSEGYFADQPARSTMGDPFNPPGANAWDHPYNQQQFSSRSNLSNSPATGNRSNTNGQSAGYSGKYVPVQSTESNKSNSLNQPVRDNEDKQFKRPEAGNMVEQVNNIAATFEAYVPWRIWFLNEELKKIAGSEKNEANKQRSEMKVESGMLEDLLLIVDTHKRIQYMLENDILIASALENDPEAQRINDIYEDDYQKMQRSSGYKKIAGRIKEKDVQFIFPICMRYRALANYLGEQKEIQASDIIQWLKDKRKEN